MTQLSLKDYYIYVGDCWTAFNAFLSQANYSRTFIIVDNNTRQHCLPLLLANSQLDNPVIVEIPAGEQHKSIETCSRIWQQMMAAKADRRALTINLGGGVIGDMGGFCASTFKRGMDFIQIPTTLLSQVDASIGGKLGIDFDEIKNSIGLFNNPKAVFIDPAFLQTLSPREVRSGFAEILKHSIIANLAQWQQLKKLRDLTAANWSELIVPSLQIKQRIVETDPFEKGLRKALNFGHTVGHAVESQALQSDRPLLHGEAIAIGMICELFLSHQQLALPLATVKEASQSMIALYGWRALDLSTTQSLIDLMKNDKKNEQDQINFTLIPQMGQAKINQICGPEQIAESLAFYQSLNPNS